MPGMVKRVLLPLAVVLFTGVAPMTSAHAQMCVRYARALTDFTIRGDAWSWWNSAAGRYERNARPAVGSVLVFKRTGSMPRGHVSVVSQVVNSRVIRVDHSWIDGEGLVRGMRVVDLSPHNDWSHVRVWHPNTDSLGMRTYPAFGFIHPTRPQGGPVMRARLDDDLVDAVRYGNRRVRPVIEAEDENSGRFVLSTPVTAPRVIPDAVLPDRKPFSEPLIEAGAEGATDAAEPRMVAAAAMPVPPAPAASARKAAKAPSRKPGARNDVAMAEVLPRHKPGKGAMSQVAALPEAGGHGRNAED